MSRSKARDLLTRLKDAAFDDLMRTSDDELLAEALEDGEDVKRLTADLRGRMSRRLEVAQVQRRRAEEPQEDRVTIQQTREIASAALLALEDSCKSRYCSYLTFDFRSPSSIFSRDGRLELAEQLLSMYIDESAEFADLFPGSRAEMVRTLLRDAIHDPQISPFVGMSLGTLVSTLCTLALGKASGLEFDARQSTAQRNRLLRKIRARKEWRACHSLIAYQPEFVTDSVDPPHAVSGLASMQSALERYQPDAIVAVAGGGEIVASFLRAMIGLDVRSYFVASRKQGEYVLDRQLASGGSRKKVVIIDDISRTGSTLASICHQTFGGLGSLEVKTLALVSSSTATRYLKDYFLVLPLVAHSPNVSVPWDNKGYYRATKTNYVFGAERKAPLEISKSFYERTYEELGP